MPEFNKHSTGSSDSRAQPHRCNAHLEDVLEGLSTWPMDVSKPFGVFLQCIKSQPGMREEKKKRGRGFDDLFLVFTDNNVFFPYIRSRTTSLLSTKATTTTRTTTIKKKNIWEISL